MSENEAAAPAWRDRIKELRRVPAAELKANPKNWREHPPEQQKAIQGILKEVGIAGALLARETPDGLELIDGHLRAEQDDATEWPVLVLDVTEDEADVLLASYDPIGAMARQNDKLYASLLDDLTIEDADLDALLTDIRENGLKGLGEEKHDKYTRKVEVPIYEPKRSAPPSLTEMLDDSRTRALREDILAAAEAGEIDDEARELLTFAAERHTRFRYDEIAEYYAHASPAVQKLMEDSALVIVDFDRAIELGFVKLTEGFQKVWERDHEK